MYNLLIVDDEPLVRRGIKTFLDIKSLNIDNIIEAENGEQALRLFKEKEVQIVLADINMPKMNGLDLSKAIKSIKPETKIALITGYDYFDYAQKALKIGVDDYILKPVSKDDISAIILNLIHKLEQENKNHKIEAAVEQLLDQELPEQDSDYGNQIRTYIDEHIGDSSLSLGSLADALALSQGYLSGLFKKLFGLSFQDYIGKNRMEKAKVLLLTSSMKNYEIAEAVGFEDPNYFSSRFKRYTGKTPKQYKSEMV